MTRRIRVWGALELLTEMAGKTAVRDYDPPIIPQCKRRSGGSSESRAPAVGGSPRKTSKWGEGAKATEEKILDRFQCLFGRKSSISQANREWGVPRVVMTIEQSDGEQIWVSSEQEENGQILGECEQLLSELKAPGAILGG